MMSEWLAVGPATFFYELECVRGVVYIYELYAILKHTYD
jgi:hypothetical protein